MQSIKKTTATSEVKVLEFIRKAKTVYIYFKRPRESATSVIPQFEFTDTAQKVMRNLSTTKTYLGEILSLADSTTTKVKAHASVLQQEGAASFDRVRQRQNEPKTRRQMKAHKTEGELLTTQKSKCVSGLGIILTSFKTREDFL